MCLREILEKLANNGDQVLLCDGNNRDWEAGALLDELSGPMLKKQAYFQPGLYIAEINDAGYLGHILYRVRAKA
ncbi:MAG: hypothetical protein WBC70_00355 [Candidatus Aminicenantales bacterium]